MKIKNVHIFGGGTVSHISNHFAVCAPAYGMTANDLARIISHDKRYDSMNVKLELTRMAGGTLETNEDVAKRIDELKADYNTKIIFFNCALVDYTPSFYRTYRRDDNVTFTVDKSNTFDIGKYELRFDTNRNPNIDVGFQTSNKIIPTIRKGRKDIFLVGFKTTCGASKQEMYEKGLRLCKTGSVNLVVVNDTKTHVSFIVTPEEATYGDFNNRYKTLQELVDITWHRSHLTFTQSTVIDGKPVDWNSDQVPHSLRTVVNYCIGKGAYKPFTEKQWTAGHFAHKLSNTEFLTSIRKSNLNDLDKNGLVYVKTDGPDTVIAYGAKPSVGGQSQRIVFRDHSGYDCIVHFHSELKNNHPDNIPTASQREITCGSHECGKNTSDHLRPFLNGRIKAVMLDNHGPNIIFNKDIDPQLVINFIEQKFGNIKMNYDKLSTRIKEQYENRTRYFVPRRTFTILRLDGKAFHTYTKGLTRPFDTGLMEDMDHSIVALMSEIQGAVLAYTQSDEISILITDFEKETTSAWFDGNLQKMVSVAASIMTAEFNKYRIRRHQMKAFDGLTELKVLVGNGNVFVQQYPANSAYFDCRVFTIPDRIEVMNYFRWRQQDCIRNSVSMVAQSNFSHGELQGKSQADMHEMLHKKGINWATGFTNREKNGRVIVKELYRADNPCNEINLSDGKPSEPIMRSKWTVNGAWVFSKDDGKLLNMIPQYE